MKSVFTLRNELAGKPEYVRLAQELTLNPAKPLMGLAGAYGLFGSSEWWKHIEDGVMPRALHRGVIVEIFYAGMDSDRRPNSFRMATLDGAEFEYSMRANAPDQLGLYKVEAEVEVLLAFDPLKSGGASQVVLEIRLGTGGGSA